MAKKFINYKTDNIISPWEEHELKEADQIKKLQEDFLERETEKKQSEQRIETLTKKTISPREKKDLQKKAEEIKKLYALDYWMRCFNKVSYHNKIAGQAVFHSCIGQALNLFKIYSEDNSEIDWRFHFLWIQDSSSGKGKAMNFVNRVFSHPKFKKYKKYTDLLEPKKYKTYKLGRMNPASLINTYITTANGKIKTDRNGLELIKKGIVESNDFIFSEEGRILLESNPISLELQEILMTCMETIGSPNNIYTKQLTDYVKPCETRCTASFLVTTRPFGKVKQTLVESGLIQRMVFYPRSLDFDNRKKMNKMSSFSFKTNKNERTNFNHDLNALVDEINKVVEFAHKTEINFHPEKIEELLSFIYEKTMFFTEDVENTIPTADNRYILQSFVGRYKENMVVMAFHSAAMRFSPFVERQDLQYAFDFFEKLFISQKLWVSLSVEENREMKKEDSYFKSIIKKFLKKDLNETTEVSDLAHHLAKKANKEYYCAKYHITKFSKGSHPFIRLVEKEGSNRKIVKLAD